MKNAVKYIPPEWESPLKYTPIQLNEGVPALIDRLVHDFEEVRPLVNQILQEEVGINTLLRLDETKRYGIKIKFLFEDAGSIEKMRRILFGGNDPEAYNTEKEKRNDG